MPTLRGEEGGGMGTFENVLGTTLITRCPVARLPVMSEQGHKRLGFWAELFYFFVLFLFFRLSLVLIYMYKYIYIFNRAMCSISITWSINPRRWLGPLGD